MLGLSLDLFGNATNISDGGDPHYAPPGGAWPTAGFQFTPELAGHLASDGDGLSLLGEFTAGTDPTDTDDDAVADGTDTKPQNRLLPLSRPPGTVPLR